MCWLRHADRVLLPVARTTADDGTLPRCNGASTGPASWWRPGSGCWNRPGPACRRRWSPRRASSIVPALAVDRTGARLGRGRGFYDRTLVLRDSEARG